MKSITQIKNRLRNERIDSKYSPSHRQNIKVLKWVLEGEDLSTCEANSSAVLAEVLKIIDKRYLKEDGIKNIDFNKIDSVVRECIKIEINKCLNEIKKEILSISLQQEHTRSTA